MTIPRARGLTIALPLVCIMLPPAAAGQQSSGSAEGEEAEPVRSVAGAAPRARAARLEGSLSIDGRLDEPAWQAAPVITDFVQGEPVEGAEPTEPTEVRVLFDEGSLYIGARMHESDPDDIRAQLVRRDERGAFDYFEVALDPNLDGLTGYQFRVSAAGAEGDTYLYGDVREDEDWDAVWNSAVTRDGSGWTAELHIPLSQIRYDGGAGAQTWGVNFTRRRLVSNEVDYFALQSRTERGRVSQFGEITGLRVGGASRRLEIRPFVVSQVRTAPAEAGNPLFDGAELSPRGGADVSVGIGSAFSLDATFNPDFGQVEVDPEVINLTAFESFFPEKRPFFVQDAQVFDFTGSQGGRGGRGGKTLFFSRRIGRSPRGHAPEGADFTRRPPQTTILGAAKLTGRTSGGLSMGALAAVTGRETGDAYFAAPDSIIRFVAEPPTGYGVLRLQQDFREGGSKIGMIATGLRRELPDDGTLDFLPSSAYSFGLDFEHQWGGERSRDWRLWGFFSSSLVTGSEEALLEIQESSSHFFQRPDADYLEVDSTRTSMFGSDWRLQLERQGGEHWTWSTWLGEQTPGFEINDFGFITSGERLDVGARVEYREIRPGSLFRDYELGLSTFHNLRHSLLDDLFSGSNWARSHESGAVSFNGRFTFLNNWGLNVFSFYSPESQSDTRTRGGPLMTDPAEADISIRLNTDRRDAFHLEPSIGYQTAFTGDGREISSSLGITFRPTSSWEIAIEPEVRFQRESAQYVSQTDTLPFAPTYGGRYLFGDLERTTVSMETRMNVTFSPDLSLQLYAQPLISSGDYLSYRQLARAESFEFLDFEEGAVVSENGGVLCRGGTTCVLDDTRYFDFDGDGAVDHDTSDRDFNIRSLRGNAVLRWEYRPGSLLFLVWQHGRRDERDIGDLSLGRDLGGLFDAPAENVFILKLSHYLSF